MTAKRACGNCGSKAGCGCGTASPYEQGLQAVWHDPTSYNLVEHGPSFLPGTKLASNQKAEVRAFLKRQAAFYDTSPTFLTQEPLHPLSCLLACLRGLSIIHQTHHWQTRGSAFYADHLLFQRLYEESQEFIDQVAERAVGSVGVSLVNAHQQVDLMHQIIQAICQNETGEDPDQMVQHSLHGEVVLLGVLTAVLQQLEGSGALTPGTSNLLEGLADKHETFVYLLKQRTSNGHQASSYSYERS